MKKIVLVLLVIVSCKVLAQEQTLFSGKVTHGGFGGPEVKFTQINENLAVLVGGKGGWIINHTFVIGGGGYGLVSNLDFTTPGAAADDYVLNFGYGGLYLEYIQDWDKLLHYSFSALIGAGGIGYRLRNGGDVHNNDYPSKSFFVAEPGANAEVNVASFFRINLGVSYRWISGVQLGNFNDQNLAGLSANLTLKFGKF